MSYVRFDSWHDVLAYVAAGRPVYYQAPMMHAPVLIRAKLTKNRRWVRVYPIYPAEFDAFTADEGHLDRFRRPGIAMASRRRHGSMTRRTRAEHGYGRSTRGAITEIGKYVLESHVTSHRGRRVYEAGVFVAGTKPKHILAVGYGQTRDEAETNARREAGV